MQVGPLDNAGMLRKFAIMDGREATCVDLPALMAQRTRPLPHTLRIVLENVARQVVAGEAPIETLNAVANWSATADELIVPLKVARLMLPDSSGLPVLMDLAAARDRVAELGGPADRIEPQLPITLVVDHSLIVDVAGHPNARHKNIGAEYRRNRERYEFFKWAQQAFNNVKVVPPGAGIIHQVHIERLARLVDSFDIPEVGPVVGPEFVLGCDSHTTMAGGMGLLAWGVGGIDGEAAALGQKYVVRIPRVVGVRLSGALPAGASATDLVLTVTERLRKVGVVGAFVEFFGPGLAALGVADRATIANMAPEYGATVGFFPIDAQTIGYLQQTGRAADHIALVESYARAAGLFAELDTPDPEYSEIVEIDLSQTGPSLAGPKRPQDRVPLPVIKDSFRAALTAPVTEGGFGLSADATSAEIPLAGLKQPIRHGTITIAAITSCTNTSNPSVMIAAGLLARNAVARGLTVPAWVKTSLAPGSRLVEDYLIDAGLMTPLEALGFGVVGFGCTTCSGKSGPIEPAIAEAVLNNDIVAAAVLSGNRNFEGRIHKTCRAAYLCSPPLVLAFALAGRVDVDFEVEALGRAPDGTRIYLRDIWPDAEDIAALVATSQKPERFRQSYATLFDGAELWQNLNAPTGPRFEWDPDSSYIRRPPYFDHPAAMPDDTMQGLRVLAMAGDSLTTDQITPSGEIMADTQAGKFLMASGVDPKDFNAVTQRRGNHDFMARVTFANQRMKNLLVPGVEGGFTRTTPAADPMTIFDAAETFRAQNTPVMVLAGKDYGMGSSRDWAAKGPMLLGVRLVLAVNFERIHRSNLIGMGILPLIFEQGASADTLGLSGFEDYAFEGISEAIDSGTPVGVLATSPDGTITRFTTHLDIASAEERTLLREGGIFASILRDAMQDNEGTMA